MSSPDSAEKSLKSVAAEVIAAEEEDAALTEHDGHSEHAGDSSAAVLEVSSGGESLEHELAMAQHSEEATLAAAPLPASVVESVVEPRPPQMRSAGSATLPAGSTASQSSQPQRTQSLPRQASAPIRPPAPQQQAPPPSQSAGEEDGLVVKDPEGDSAGGPPAMSVTEKLLDFKRWSVTQLKCTRQYIAEQVGTGTRTTDTKLSDRLKVLMAQRDKYNALLKLALKLCAQVRDIKATQRDFAGILGSFTARVEELGTELEVNAKTQRQLARNGDILYEALSTFCSNLQLLLNKTMEDTFTQLKVYQAARIEFDAYRSDEASARAAAEANPGNATKQSRWERKRQELAERKERFETLRKDLTVRVHFLEQNQLRVMTRQLTLFHNATCAYFMGDAEQLEKCIRQFHIKMPQNLGPDAQAASAAEKEESVPLEPLPFPTPSELGTPSEALSSLLMQQLTATDESGHAVNSDDHAAQAES